MEILRLQGRKNNHIKLNQYYSLKQEFLNKKKTRNIENNKKYAINKNNLPLVIKIA